MKTFKVDTNPVGLITINGWWVLTADEATELSNDLRDMVDQLDGRVSNGTEVQTES